MCSHYQAVTALERFERSFQAAAPRGQLRADMWPTYPAAAVVSRTGQREAIIGRWGLVAATAKAINPKLSTFNARCETVATSPTYKGAWAKGQRCIVPAEAVYEPDWRSGRHVPTRLQRADGNPLAIAGLWDSWALPSGEVLLSFTMLTINADAHPLMKHMHRPQDEKRMLVMLADDAHDEWLNAGLPPGKPTPTNLLAPYPAECLVATGEPSQTLLDNPGLF